MDSRGSAEGNRTKVIAVGSSSKKAGKSTLAAHLVRELGAEYGLKVSGGSTCHSEPLVTDPDVIAERGTDTGALVEAGARKVLWVNAPADTLQYHLKRAFELFPAGGLLVAEGNSVFEHLQPDLGVFVMAVPFEQFKPSASLALSLSDLVLVDLTDKLSGGDAEQISLALEERAPSATVLFFLCEAEREKAFAETVRLARERLRALT